MKNWQIHEGLSGPVNVTWEVTNRCNLNCIHCLSDAGAAKGAELSLDQCTVVIDQLAEQRVFQVNFGGGEPFAREDFLDILEACHLRGLVTCISTNGTLLDRNILGFLKDSELVYLQVSLDGASQAVNDRIRGQGTFRLILGALERLRTWEIPFSINMVLTRLNYPEVDAIHRLAEGFDVKLRISRFRPSGRGEACWHELSLVGEELRAFSKWLTRHRDVVTGDSFFSLEEDERKGLGLNLCGAAKFTCCIDPQGDVYPCAFLQDQLFCGGSLMTQLLEQIWVDSRGFLLLRNLRIQSCETCFRYDACHGGCPAVAYFTEGSLDIPDPECLVECINLHADPIQS